MNAENSKRAENNRVDDDNDNDINNKKDLCLSFIESFESLKNLSFEVDENTFLSLKKIAQTLSDDDFLDIDEFLHLVWKMSNSTLSIDDESMSTIIISEICDFLKRKTDTVDLNESDRVRIHDNAIFTSISTCLIVLQNTHSKFSITLSNQSLNLAMSETRTQTSCRSERTSSY